jgi:hypothetical protein
MWQVKISLSRHLGFFEKKIHNICVLPTPNECKKKIENIEYSQSYAKKSDFDPPFLIHFTKYALGAVC